MPLRSGTTGRRSTASALVAVERLARVTWCVDSSAAISAKPPQVPMPTPPRTCPKVVAFAHGRHLNGTLGGVGQAWRRCLFVAQASVHPHAGTVRPVSVFGVLDEVGAPFGTSAPLAWGGGGGGGGGGRSVDVRCPWSARAAVPRRRSPHPWCGPSPSYRGHVYHPIGRSHRLATLVAVGRAAMMPRSSRQPF